MRKMGNKHFQQIFFNGKEVHFPDLKASGTHSKIVWLLDKTSTGFIELLDSEIKLHGLSPNSRPILLTTKCIVNLTAKVLYDTKSAYNFST